MTRAIIYRRVSTDEQGLGLDAQYTTAAKAITDRGWTEIMVRTDNATSGAVAPIKRPAFAEALGLLESGEADALVVAKLDRATRSVADLCDLLDRANQQGWTFVALDSPEVGTPMGRAMVQISGVFAELERAMIRQRTRDALAALKASGRRLGRPVELAPAVRARIADEHARGDSLRAIADRLTTEQVPTARGGRWHASTIRGVLHSLALDSLAHDEQVAAA